MDRAERDFRKLLVWQKAHALAVLTYKETTSFPRDERYGLTSQARRAAVSVPANIAEGCGRSGETELARYMTIAQGSASELDYYFTLATDLCYWPQAKAYELGMQIDEVKRMLSAYISRLKS